LANNRIWHVMKIPQIESLANAPSNHPGLSLALARKIIAKRWTQP
jgi:hypothetical protein